jgi:hypothetical protein
MRSVIEYLARAAQFDELARSTSEETLKNATPISPIVTGFSRGSGNGSLQPAP